MQIPANRLTYTFHSDSAGDKIATPIGESTFKISMVLFDDPVDPRYDYDITFTGELIFKGADYHWLKDLEESGERCDTLFIELNDPKCEDAELFPGTFVKLTSGEYDLDKCIVKLTVSANDKYEIFNASKDDTLDIFNAGSTVNANLLDPSIEFEFMDWSETSAADFLFSAQDFSGYPNINSEYPDFGIDGEEFFAIAGANEQLYDSDPAVAFTNLETHVTTGRPKLHDGDVPRVDGGLYASAALAAAQGWRLCYSSYAIKCENDIKLSWEGRWVWCVMKKTVPTGTPVPGWIFQGTVGPDDIYYHKPIMNKKSRGVDATGENFYSNLKWATTLTTDPWAFRSEMVNYIVGYDGSGPEKWGREYISNGILLNDIIVYSLGHCDPSLTVKSDFFQIDPWTVDTDNPITELESTTNEIIVFQKTDVKRPFDTARATSGKYTTNELIQWLWEMFRVKYRIVGTDFMLEHYSSTLFNHAVVIDLTLSPYQEWLNGTRVYTYEQINLPSKETFAFMDTRPDINIFGFGEQSDFVGAHLLYDGNCVDRSKATGTVGHALGRVSTDIEFIVTNGKLTDTIIADDGFVFASCKLDTGEYYIRSLPPILGDAEQINNVMGWAFLHSMFFMAFANAETGTMNNSPVTFDSIKWIKRTRRLTFPICCIDTFDMYAFMTCALGTGILKTIEYYVSNGMMTVEIGLQD